MFCHKCGAQIAEGAAFCQKCGTKVVHTDDIQQPMDTTTPIAEPQSAGTVGPMIAERIPLPIIPPKKTTACIKPQPLAASLCGVRWRCWL